MRTKASMLNVTTDSVNEKAAHEKTLTNKPLNEESLSEKAAKEEALNYQRRKKLEEMDRLEIEGKLDKSLIPLRDRLRKIVLPTLANEQQRMFYFGKIALDKFEQIEKKRPLTYKEEIKRNDIKEDLFNAIRIFGIDEARKRMGKYRLDSDAYQDVQQAIAAIFYEKLPAYKPLWTTPTTYYVRYFKQAVTEYLLDSSQHLTQYDAKNVGIVRAAIHAFESKGIKWDEHMIVESTNLSMKVVKQTIALAQNSIRANVDDLAVILRTKVPTPEEHYIDEESKESLLNALLDTLSEEELKFFLYRVNLDGIKERPYQAIADELHMKIRDVKKEYSAIVAKLGNNEYLRTLTRSEFLPTDAEIHLQVDVGQDIEDQLVSAFTEFGKEMESTNSAK